MFLSELAALISRRINGKARREVGGFPFGTPTLSGELIRSLQRDLQGMFHVKHPLQNPPLEARGQNLRSEIDRQKTYSGGRDPGHARGLTE